MCQSCWTNNDACGCRWSFELLLPLAKRVDSSLWPHFYKRNGCLTRSVWLESVNWRFSLITVWANRLVTLPFGQSPTSCPIVQRVRVHYSNARVRRNQLYVGLKLTDVHSSADDVWQLTNANQRTALDCTPLSGQAVNGSTGQAT